MLSEGWCGNMKLSSFGKLLSPTYTDRLSINRFTEITNPDGTIGMGLPKTPLYSDVQCRISFNSSDNPETTKEDSNPIYLQVKIFCSPSVDIKKGDILNISFNLFDIFSFHYHVAI